MTMNRLFHGPNAGYVLELYEQYTRDPESVDPDTRTIFERWTPDGSNGAAPVAAEVDLTRVVAAIELAVSIRRSGHRVARLDPLGSEPPGDPSLDPATHSISETDLAALPATIVGGPLADRASNAAQAIALLRERYCSTTGYDFEHVQNAEERAWLWHAAESGEYHRELGDQEKRGLLELLTRVEAYEKFTHRAYFGAKRFSVEGNDMLVSMVDELVRRSAGDGVSQVMIGMAHRGRLNTLLHILGKTYEQVFAQFAGKGPGHEVGNDGWTGDVKYHMGWEREPGDLGVRVTVASNPSHLEFVNPVVTGMARAVQEERDNVGVPRLDVNRCLPVQVHGDASFPGEGIVTETLNLSLIPGYTFGGSLHIIVNNQIGFTT
jgi:2-oxoglutarate dehydrogenase E1 component